MYLYIGGRGVPGPLDGHCPTEREGLGATTSPIPNVYIRAWEDRDHLTHIYLARLGRRKGGGGYVRG